MVLQYSAHDIDVDTADAPLWVDILFLIAIVCIHWVYAFKFTHFSLNFLHAKCDQVAKKKKVDISRIYLRSVSDDKEDYELDKYAKHCTNFTELWVQSLVLRWTLKIATIVSLIISFFLIMCLVVNLLFEFVVTCIKDANERILGLMFLPIFIFVCAIFTRFVIQSMSVAWNTGMDTVADAMAKQHDEIDDKRHALEDIENEAEKAQCGIPEPIEVAAEDKTRLTYLTAPYFAAVRWRLLWMVCCIVATVLAVARTQTEFAMSDSFFFKLFVRYMMMAALAWNAVYFLAALAASIYGQIVYLMYLGSSAAATKTKPEMTGKKAWQSRLCRCFCLKGAFGIHESDEKSMWSWKNCRVRLNVVLVQLGLILIIGGSIANDSMVRFLGVILILYYFSTLLLVCKPRGLYYLWKFDVEALELETDESVVFSQRQRAFTEMEATDAASLHSILSKGNTVSHLKHEIDERYQDQEDHQRHIELQVVNVAADEEKAGDDHEVVNGGQPVETASAVAAVQDTDEKKTEEEEEEEKQETEPAAQLLEQDEEAKQTVPLQQETKQKKDKKKNKEKQKKKKKKKQKKKKNKWKKKKKDAEKDTAELFLDLFLEVHNARRSAFELWDLESDGRCFKKYCTDIPFLMLLNYLTTLFKCYKFYWLLILPHDYDTRPYSVCCGGDSMIEDCWKWQSRRKDTEQKIKALAEYCWRRVSALFVIIIMCFIIILVLYGAVFFSNAIAPVRYTEYESYRLKRNASKLYPICETRYGDLSVLDLGFFADFAYEISTIERDHAEEMSVQDPISMYFDHHLAGNTTTDPPSWHMKYFVLQDPAFFHVRNDETASDLIAIRGTKTRWDAVQSLGLFGSVGLLQMFSMMVPVTSLTPTSFIIKFVWFASFFEGIVDDTIRHRWDEPVYDYAWNLLNDYVENGTEIDALYIVGHSLGGGISQAVAARLYYMNKYFWDKEIEIKSYSLAAPGMTYGSRKFEFDLESLFMTSIVVHSDDDVVAKIDKQGGMSQIVECREKSFAKCHPAYTANCELFNHCHANLTKSTYLYSRMCEDPGSIHWRDPVLEDILNTTQT